jgi:hypothetical protein
VAVRHERGIHRMLADVLELDDGLFVVTTEDLHGTASLRRMERG